MARSDYSIVNEFSSLLSAGSRTGASSVPDLALDNLLSSSQNFSNIMRRQAYERLDDLGLSLSNPDFAYGSSGRILPSIADSPARQDPRLVRGYIRRSVLDNADPTSRYRLYFMYNPETIQRNYVSYLDQQALDPFNTILGSNNLVAPPGVLDFSFELFFDRQIENANGAMPRGVLEDFDYFDLVIRGVVPDRQTPDLPDNGVMMINPRNVTIVFSPQLSVQGRPNTASVIYEKFDHRMRPTRMRIAMSIKAYYIGPVRQDFTFAASREEGTVQATVPYETGISVVVAQAERNYDVIKEGGPKNLKPPVWEDYGNNDINSVKIGRSYRYGISSPFGPRGDGFHWGVDIGTPIGVTVIAPFAARVEAAGEASSGLLAGFDQCVVLEVEGDYCFFAHLSEIYVKAGDYVTQYQPLGLTGPPGGTTPNARGPHLHFEIRTGSPGGPRIDPTFRLAKPSVGPAPVEILE